MRLLCERLHRGSDLKLEIVRIAKQNNIPGACIVNAVGSLSELAIRTDVKNNKPIIKNYGKVEIVSLIGTIGENGTHVHIHIAGGLQNGNVVGGHLIEGCMVHTTVELMLLITNEYIFKTELDSETGFDELKIVENN